MVKSSLEGGKPFQINGEGFGPNDHATDHSVFFESGSATYAGQEINNDYDFLSSMSSGFIYYETPHLDDILPDSQKGTKSLHQAVVKMKGPADEQGNPTSFRCDSDSH